MARVIAAVLVLLALCAPTAAGGGSIRAFALLPGAGRLALVDVDAGHVLRTVAVPAASRSLAASIDGSEVLVATPTAGVVTELDGLTGRRVHVFAGLGRPVAIVLAPLPGRGLVRPRYAFVADARGEVDVLDLARGLVVRRVGVPRPAALALAGQQLWVASAGLPDLTVIDVSSPPRARAAGRAQAGLVPIAIAADPGGLGVDAASRSGTVVRIDGVTLTPWRIVRLRPALDQLLAGTAGLLWAAAANGRVVAIDRHGGVVRALRVTPGSRLELVGGWLAAFRGRSLRLLRQQGGGGARVVFPASIGAVAFAVT